MERWATERESVLGSDLYLRAEDLRELCLLGVPRAMPRPVFDTDIDEEILPFIDRQAERDRLGRIINLYSWKTHIILTLTRLHS